MMVCLFSRDATDFSTNGLKVLQPVACTVTEEINGNYSLQLTMPQGDATVQPEMIIRAPTPKNGNQLFRVYKPKVDMAGNNVYQCRHIFYDLLDDFIEDTRPTGNGQAALSAILSGTGFTGSSDIAGTSSAEYQMMNPVKALLGGNDSDDNAFVNRWGGEIERDNFEIRMNQHIGMDRGVAIRYRKNLTGLTLETDMSGVMTRIYPTGRRSDGQTLLKLPEKYVDSPLIGNYVHPKIQRIDYSDIQVVDKTDDDHPQTVTEAQALDQLRTAAAAKFAGGADKPVISAEVEFIPLEATEEYKTDGLAGLEKVYIGDTVHVFHEPLGIELSAKVVSYEYDALTQRYNTVTLGSVAQMVGSVQSTVGKIATGAQSSADSAQKSADEANASIEVLNGQITLKADKGNLVAEINISPETIKISASKLELDGLVTITGVEDGTTEINGACIKTGKIVSSDDNSSFSINLETGEIVMKKGTFSGSVIWSNGSLTQDPKNGNALIQSNNDVEIEGTSLRVNALTSGSINLAGDTSIDGKFYANGEMGITKSVPVKNWDGKGTRCLLFRNGICIGIEDD